jgi:hypothetical protein
LVEGRTSSCRGSVLETYFVASVYLLSLLSLIAIALLSVGFFSLRNVAIGAAVSAAVSLWALRHRSFMGRARWRDLGILGVLLLAISFRSNPTTFLNGGQDPGVYSAMALHFARTGSLELKDTLLADISDNKEITSYYLKRSMHRLREKRPNKWVGNMLPGVYLTNLEKNQWDFQFYALHPMWLAIGNWMFGLQGQSWILVLFSTLTVLSAFFITQRITGGYAPSLCAAFLLAINPGHAYFATFPVSETVAGFFFLSAIYLLLDKRFIGFLAPLLALFLTRITGFITAPLLLASLGWMAVRRRDPRPIWAGCGVIVAYAISFYWGLTFAPHYSFDIYKSKLGLARGSLQYAGTLFLGALAAWAIFGFAVIRYHKRLRLLTDLLARRRYAVSGCIIVLLIGVCVYRGYQLGFTDYYHHHRWYARRWKMAGHGWLSISYLSINTLRLLLSSVGLFGFFTGLFLVGAAACRRSTLAPLALLATGFSLVFLVGQLTTPITYYFARYLVSEVVPLACICAAVALYLAGRFLPWRGGYLFPLFSASVLISVWPALIGKMSAIEGEGISRAVECLDEITGANSVLLMDRQGLAFGAYSYSTPLRLGFGKRVYSVLYNDFRGDPAKLDALVSYFQGKGLEVFLVSSNAQWSGRSGFQNALTIPIEQKLLLGRARLPSRFWRRTRTLRLYAQRAGVAVPSTCGPMVAKMSM